MFLHPTSTIFICKILNMYLWCLMIWLKLFQVASIKRYNLVEFITTKSWNVFSLSIVVKLMWKHFPCMVFAWKQDVAKSNWPKSIHQQQFGKSNTTRDQCGTLMCVHNTNKTSINDACLGHVTWRKRSGGCISKISKLQAKLFIYVQIKQSIF